MPTAFELARTWDKEGELEQEFQELESILRERHFIRGKIIHCFESLIGSLCVRTWKKLGHQPTVQELRSEIHDYFRDRVQTVEICMSIADDRERSQLKACEDALRMLNNQSWEAAQNDNNEDTANESGND